MTWGRSAGNSGQYSVLPSTRPPVLPGADQRMDRPAASLIQFYRKHLTRYTPKCGRAGASCSQIALDLGLLAGLVAFTHCEECRGRGA